MAPPGGDENDLAPFLQDLKVSTNEAVRQLDRFQPPVERRRRADDLANIENGFDGSLQ
jgi:hypothetical protein